MAHAGSELRISSPPAAADDTTTVRVIVTLDPTAPSTGTYVTVVERVAQFRRSAVNLRGLLNLSLPSLEWPSLLRLQADLFDLLARRLEAAEMEDRLEAALPRHGTHKRKRDGIVSTHLARAVAVCEAAVKRARRVLNGALERNSNPHAPDDKELLRDMQACVTDVLRDIRHA